MDAKAALEPSLLDVDLQVPTNSLANSASVVVACASTRGTMANARLNQRRVEAMLKVCDLCEA